MGVDEEFEGLFQVVGGVGGKVGLGGFEDVDGGLEAVVEVVLVVEIVEGGAAGFEVKAAFKAGFGGEVEDGVVSVGLEPGDELLAIGFGEGGEFVVRAGFAGGGGLEDASEGELGLGTGARTED